MIKHNIAFKFVDVVVWQLTGYSAGERFEALLSGLHHRLLRHPLLQIRFTVKILGLDEAGSIFRAGVD